MHQDKPRVPLDFFIKNKEPRLKQITLSVVDRGCDTWYLKFLGPSWPVIIKYLPSKTSEYSDLNIDIDESHHEIYSKWDFEEQNTLGVNV